MNYYGIKSPENRCGNLPRLIWWITDSPHNSWVKFFTDVPNRAPMDEAIRAYEAIGYKCVELEIMEKPKPQQVRELGQEIDSDWRVS